MRVREAERGGIASQEKAPDSGESGSGTSAMVKILYISGKMTGATKGICVSVTSRVNSVSGKKKKKKGLKPGFCFVLDRHVSDQLQKDDKSLERQFNCRGGGTVHLRVQSFDIEARNQQIKKTGQAVENK